MLLVDKFIEQISVIADQRKFVSALIVPEYSVLEEWARENHIEFKDREELCQDKRVNEMMRERIETLQQRLASYEKIKRFTLLAHHSQWKRRVNEYVEAKAFGCKPPLS